MRRTNFWDAEIAWNLCVLIGVILFVLICDAAFSGEVIRDVKAEAVEDALGQAPAKVDA